MEQSDRYEFLYFSQRKDDGSVEFANPKDVENRMVLPRHPETNDLDKYYLQSMLMGFDGSGDFRSNEILDAFPVLSLTTDKDDKFYKLSIARLREFSVGEIEEDEYISASIKHLFMKNQIVSKYDGDESLLDECLSKVSPAMYEGDVRDTVDCEGYDLSRIASYVPTSQFRRMKIMKGWIEGALHYYEYSIMFFDVRFVGYDDFNENIIDVKWDDLVEHYGELYSTDTSSLHSSGLYYDVCCRVPTLNRNWLFTSPNNENERDGKVMLFRNERFKSIIEENLKSLFREGTYRLNDVFKWNRYADGGKFDEHFDTMFVSKSSDECSLYTLLIYIEVENDDNFLVLGDDEVVVQLESHRNYIIPHWVKHRVNGTGMREFIKAEIVFKNSHIGVTYDQSVADAFDQSCYYMLQSVRHPKLKDIVSRSFNAINEARFFKTQFLPALDNHIFLLKTISVPLKYYTISDHKLTTVNDFCISYITDGKYYYFKTRKGTNITSDEAIIMLSMMHVDIHPKRMFSRQVRVCDCGHEECIDRYLKQSEVGITESFFYWPQPETEAQIDQNLLFIQFPSNLGEVVSVANISVPDVKENEKTFYFAACQNIHPTHYFYETRIAEITATGRDGNYSGLSVGFIGPDKNIVKIRQSSFGNGVKVVTNWKPSTEKEFREVCVVQPISVVQPIRLNSESESDDDALLGMSAMWDALC